MAAPPTRVARNLHAHSSLVGRSPRQPSQSLAAYAAPLAYVPNEGSASISVIDTATDKVDGDAALRQEAARHRLSRRRRAAVHQRPDGNALVVVDLARSAEVARNPLGDSPEAIYLSPDGKWLSAAIEENDQVLLIDTTTNSVAKRSR